MAKRIGEMKCLNPRCGCADVAVEITGAGTWQSRCHKCGASTFAKAGTRYRRDLEQLVTLDADADPAPAPAARPAPDPEPKPAPTRAARSVFDLSSL